MHDGETREKMQEKRNALMIDYKRVFSSPEGERVLQDLMLNAGIDQDCFAPGQADSTAYSLGRRSLALRIRNFVNFDLNRPAADVQSSTGSDQP